MTHANHPNHDDLSTAAFERLATVLDPKLAFHFLQLTTECFAPAETEALGKAIPIFCDPLHVADYGLIDELFVVVKTIQYEMIEFDPLKRLAKKLPGTTDAWRYLMKTGHEFLYGETAQMQFLCAETEVITEEEEREYRPLVQKLLTMPVKKLPKAMEQFHALDAEILTRSLREFFPHDNELLMTTYVQNLTMPMQALNTVAIGVMRHRAAAIIN